MGQAQLAWLEQKMASSKDARWQLIGQQIIVQPRNPPDLKLAARKAGTGMGWEALINTLTGTGAGDGGQVTWHDGSAFAATEYGTQKAVEPWMVNSTRALLAMSEFGLNGDFDGWDGYPAARARLLQVLKKGGAPSGGRRRGSR